MVPVNELLSSHRTVSHRSKIMLIYPVKSETKIGSRPSLGEVYLLVPS